MTHQPSTAAFSLIETLIVSALFAILSGIFGLFFIRVHGGFFSAQAAADAQKDAAAIVRELGQFVPMALRVRERITINGVEYLSGTETLVLDVISITSTGEPIPDTVDVVVFVREGETMRRYVQAHAASARESSVRTVAHTLTDLTFSYATENATLSSWVDVSLVTHASTKQRSVDAMRQARFVLHNRTP